MKYCNVFVFFLDNLGSWGYTVKDRFIIANFLITFEDFKNRYTRVYTSLLMDIIILYRLHNNHFIEHLRTLLLDWQARAFGFCMIMQMN